MVGQVEDCNWNAECVAKWDEDKRNFDNMSPAEQAKAIAEKEARDEEERKKKEEEEKKQKEEEDRKKKEEDERKEREEREKKAREEAERQAQPPAEDIQQQINRAEMEASSDLGQTAQQLANQHDSQHPEQLVQDSTAHGGDEHHSAAAQDDQPSW